jgi:hypothetical protein
MPISSYVLMLDLEILIFDVDFPRISLRWGTLRRMEYATVYAVNVDVQQYCLEWLFYTQRPDSWPDLRKLFLSNIMPGLSLCDSSIKFHCVPLGY